MNIYSIMANKHFRAYATAAFFVWLGGGFMVLDWNVLNWDKLGRFVLVYTPFMYALFRTVTDNR